MWLEVRPLHPSAIWDPAVCWQREARPFHTPMGALTLLLLICGTSLAAADRCHDLGGHTCEACMRASGSLHGGCEWCQLGGTCAEKEGKQQSCPTKTDQRVLGGGKSVAQVCADKCTSQSCPVAHSVCEPQTTECHCRPGLYAHGEPGHATLCVSATDVRLRYMAGTKVAGGCVDAKAHSAECTQDLAHPRYGCNSPGGWQHMASNCQASCGEYCVTHTCKKVYREKYCVPAKDDCQDTTAVDFACPHHKLGAVLPKSCDDLTTKRDDQCARTFIRWWGKCSGKGLQLCPGLSHQQCASRRKQYQNFAAKCTSSARQRCAANGGKWMFHRRRLQYGGSADMCQCPKKGFDLRTLCATLLPTPTPHAFVVTGASGKHEANIDGVYTKTTHACHNKPVYEGHGGDGLLHSLFQPTASKTWVIGGEAGAYHCKNQGYVYASYSGSCAWPNDAGCKGKYNGYYGKGKSCGDKKDQWCPEKRLTFAVYTRVCGVVVSGTTDERFHGVYMKTANTCQGEPVYQQGTGKFVLFATKTGKWMISDKTCGKSGWVHSTGGRCGKSGPIGKDCAGRWSEPCDGHWCSRPTIHVDQVGSC